MDYNTQRISVCSLHDAPCANAMVSGTIPPPGLPLQIHYFTLGDYFHCSPVPFCQAKAKVEGLALVH